MAIKKISEFVSATPSSDSKILFEQNDKGKSCTIGDAVNTCSLSYGEIAVSTDLSGKIASASAVKESSIVPNYSASNRISVTELTTVGGTWTAPSNGIILINAVKNNDNSSSEIIIKINGIIDIRYKAGSASVFYCTQYVPLKKGDVLETQQYINIYSGSNPIFFPSA